MTAIVQSGHTDTFRSAARSCGQRAGALPSARLAQARPETTHMANRPASAGFRRPAPDANAGKDGGSQVMIEGGGRIGSMNPKSLESLVTRRTSSTTARRANET